MNMHYSEYDSKISATLKAIRKLKGIKQIVIATKIKVDNSTYCRMENGHIVITLGQLHEITKVVGIDLLHIIAIAEALRIGSNQFECYRSMICQAQISEYDFRNLLEILQELK